MVDQSGHIITINDWKISPELASNYRNQCAKAVANQSDWEVFRGASAISGVYENKHREQTVSFMGPVFKTTNYITGMRSEVELNDSVGMPQTFETDFSEYPIAGSTASYLYRMAMLEHLFGDMTGWSVAEIGGGYGGFCHLFSKKWRPVRYVSYDIAESLDVQKKFLGIVGVENGVEFRDYIPTLPDRVDLVVAFCSLCELSRSVMDKFGQNVVGAGRNGMFDWCPQSSEDDIPYSRESIIKWGDEVCGRKFLLSHDDEAMKTLFDFRRPLSSCTWYWCGSQ